MTTIGEGQVFACSDSLTRFQWPGATSTSRTAMLSGNGNDIMRCSSTGHYNTGHITTLTCSKRYSHIISCSAMIGQRDISGQHLTEKVRAGSEAKGHLKPSC